MIDAAHMAQWSEGRVEKREEPIWRAKWKVCRTDSLFGTQHTAVTIYTGFLTLMQFHTCSLSQSLTFFYLVPFGSGILPFFPFFYIGFVLLAESACLESFSITVNLYSSMW